MLTSYYAKTTASQPGAISISLYKPRYSAYSHCRILAPGKWYKTASFEDYLVLYNEVLANLNPQEVWDDLHRMAYDHAVSLGLSQTKAKEVQPILLCYEKPSDFCHRRLAANWLECNLNVEICEGFYDRRGKLVTVEPWERLTEFSYLPPEPAKPEDDEGKQLLLL